MTQVLAEILLLVVLVIQEYQICRFGEKYQLRGFTKEHR